MGITQNLQALDPERVRMMREEPETFRDAIWSLDDLPGSGFEHEWDAVSWLLSGRTLGEDDETAAPPEAFLVAGGERVDIDGFGYADGCRLFTPAEVRAIAARLTEIEPGLESRFDAERLVAAEPYRYDDLPYALENRETVIEGARRITEFVGAAASEGYSIIVWED